MEKVLQEIFWVHFFGRPYHSNGTKIHLDVTLWTKRPLPSLTRPTQISLNQLFAFLNLYQHAKKKQYARVLWPDWPHPFLTMPTPKTFKLIFMKLYQHAKNKLIPLFNSILESSNQIGHINMLKMRLFHQFAQEK